MTIYTGKSADGSDMYPVKGVYVHPDGNEWSNMPYTKEDKLWEELYPHLAKNLRSLSDEYELILNRQSKLSRRLREGVKHLIETNQ
jgi:hypothetical protein